MQPKANNARRALIGLVHLAFFRMQCDDAEYRTQLEKMTGARSCKNLTDSQLEALVEGFRATGVLDEASPTIRKLRGGRGCNRPTPKQWAAMESLAVAVGFRDIEDPTFKNFLRRTAKVDSPRFLTRGTVSSVILGLQRWMDQKSAATSKKGER